MTDMEERFWEKVDKGGEDDCWPWTGAVDKDGYGRFIIDGEEKRAHRIAYKFKHGSVPDDRLVLHTCDNPPCCNAAHLKLGDDEDNAEDRDGKLTAKEARYLRGEGV